MNIKSGLVMLLALLAAVVTTGVVGAQDAAPRAIPTDIVINSSFEPDKSFWTVTAIPGNKVKCGGVGHAATNCAFLFNSMGVNVKLQQVYTAGVNASATQYIGFTSHIRPLAAGLTFKFFVKIKFNNGASPLVTKFNYTSSAASANYESVEFDTDLFNPATVNKVLFGVTNKSASGKAYVDEFFVGAYDG